MTQTVRKMNGKLIFLIGAIVFIMGGLVFTYTTTAKKASTKSLAVQQDIKNKQSEAQTNMSTPSVEQGTDTPNPPSPIFTVSSLTVNDPKIVYNNDKLGSPYKACRVGATITASAAGVVKYYWDTYHPQYYNPSNKGLEESVVFEQAGTKNITLETYASDDSRRFTLFISEPNNVSKATANQIWCPST